MGLSSEQRLRYARHLLLPELGETGQLRLLSGRARVEGGAEGAREVAEAYLQRAGVQVLAWESADVDVHEDARAHGDGDVDGDLLSVGVPDLLCPPHLVEAARAVAGAFAAAEAIKAIAGIGRPGQLDRDLFSLEDV